jgi:integrase
MSRTAARTQFTPKMLDSLAQKPAEKGKRYTIFDSIVPGFGVRVTDTGKRSFVVVKRIAGRHSPVRMLIGHYPEMPLAKARDDARGALALLAHGKHPEEIAEQEREEQAAHERAMAVRAASKFEDVAERFIGEYLADKRRAADAARLVRRELVGRWRGRAIADVSRADVAQVVREIAARSPSTARQTFAYAKLLFDWAEPVEKFGMSPASNPTLGIKRSKLIPSGPVNNKRTLTDDEMRAVWKAADSMGYPIGSIYKLLILTGLRLNGVVDASWREIDIKRREWIVPAERMKGKNEQARPFLLPLTDDMLTILEALPRGEAGDSLFSHNGGASALWFSDKSAKKKIDALMAKDFAEPIPDWDNHDIRRTFRTTLSRLRVPEDVREAMLAHAKPSISGTCDIHDDRDEKADGFRSWNAHVIALVSLKKKGRGQRGYSKKTLPKFILKGVTQKDEARTTPLPE